MKQPMYTFEWGFDDETNEDYVRGSSTAYGLHDMEPRELEVALNNFRRLLELP